MESDEPRVDEYGFRILLSEYESLMQSERSFYTIAGSLTAVAGAFTSVLAGALALAPGKISVPPAGWVLLPILPLLTLSYLAYLSVMGKLRGPYIRAVESALQRFGGTIDMVSYPPPDAGPDVSDRTKSFESWKVESKRSGRKEKRTWSYLARVQFPAQHNVVLPLVSPEYGPWQVSAIFALPSIFGFLLAASVVVIADIKVGWNCWQIATAFYSALLLVGGGHFLRILWGKYDRAILERTPAVASFDGGSSATERIRSVDSLTESPSTPAPPPS